MHKPRKLLIVALAALALLGAVGCGSEGESPTTGASDEALQTGTTTTKADDDRVEGTPGVQEDKPGDVPKAD
jgi:hypothetical protein